MNVIIFPYKLFQHYKHVLIETFVSQGKQSGNMSKHLKNNHPKDVPEEAKFPMNSKRKLGYQSQAHGEPGRKVTILQVRIDEGKQNLTSFYFLHEAAHKAGY